MSQKAIVALMAQAMITKASQPPQVPGMQQQIPGMPKQAPGTLPPGSPSGTMPKAPAVKAVPGMNKEQLKQTPLKPLALPGSTSKQIKGSVFSPYDVAGMSTTEIFVLQNAGLLPKDKNELKDEMEDKEPGILDQLSDELKEYFEHVEKESATIEPEDVTSKDETEHKKKFTKKELPKDKRDIGDRAKSVTGKPLGVKKRETKFSRRYM